MKKYSSLIGPAELTLYAHLNEMLQHIATYLHSKILVNCLLSQVLPVSQILVKLVYDFFSNPAERKTETYKEKMKSRVKM